MAAVLNRLPFLLSAALVLALPPLPPLAPHPRRVLTPQRLAAARSEIASGGDAAAFGALLFAHADWALTRPPTPRGKPDATGVLMPVRAALDIMLTTAAAAALNGTAGVARGAPYFERALREVNQLCFNWSAPNETDWNFVAHALDAGEATFAVGLAYDWLWPALTAGERQGILAALVAHGLGQFAKYLPDRKVAWWVNNSINWNCVCSAGGVVGALAIAGDGGAPAWLLDAVVAPLVAGVAPCVAAVHADSSWMEGPGYWGFVVFSRHARTRARTQKRVHPNAPRPELPLPRRYANKYNAWLFSALLGTFNSTLGLEALPGVAHAARFPLYMAGAGAVTAANASRTWDWADSHEPPLWQPFMSFWGGAFDERAAAYASRVTSRAVAPQFVRSSVAWGGFVEATAFFDARGTAADVQALPTAALYNFAQLGVFRSPWFAARQNYIGFKGGDVSAFAFCRRGARLEKPAPLPHPPYTPLPHTHARPAPQSRWNHAHLDLGSFVFDLDGQRFAEDMGGDSYELPGYFGPQRWSYYRLNSHGHNVPLFGNASQVPAGANITAFSAAPAVKGGLLVDGWGVADLSRGYAGAGQPASVRRGFVSLNASSAILVVDEWRGVGGNVSVQLHTRAAVALSGAAAALSLGGVAAQLAVLPASTSCGALGAWAVVELAPLLPSPPFDSAAGFRRVEALAPPGAPCTRVAVALGDPAVVLALAGVAVAPLDDWATAGPL